MTKKFISKLPQYLHEYESWERLLDFFKQENAFLKTRLSKVLDDDREAKLLSFAEQFQNKFIRNDEYINKLFNRIDNISEEVKMVSENKYFNSNSLLEERHTVLSEEINLFENKFTLLKNDFNTFLNKMI